MSAYWDCNNPNCVEITATKNLSNVVLMDCDGTHYKFDNLNQGNSGTFCHPSGLPVATVWIKAGCYLSGDGPGYGHRFDAPCNYCPPQTNSMPVSGGNPSADTGFQVYPNPFRDHVNFRFVPEMDSQVKLEVFDALGRLLETVFEGNVSAGVTYEYKFSNIQQVDGMLIYRLTTDGEVQMGKLMHGNF